MNSGALGWRVGSRGQFAVISREKAGSLVRIRTIGRFALIVTSWLDRRCLTRWRLRAKAVIDLCGTSCAAEAALLQTKATSRVSPLAAEVEVACGDGASPVAIATLLITHLFRRPSWRKRRRHWRRAEPGASRAGGRRRWRL